MTELPKRKHPRLKAFDYSLNGLYFVTICTAEHKETLCDIVGRGLAPAEIKLTPLGKIEEEQLLSLKTRYPLVEINFLLLCQITSIFYCL